MITDLDDRGDEEYLDLFYDATVTQLYHMLDIHPASEKWSKDIVVAIEQLLSEDVMVDLHRLLPCFGLNNETLSGCVARIIASALRLPGEEEHALYAGVSLSLLAAR